MEERNYQEETAGDLAFKYTMLFATNVNLQRMCTDLIDGLKPVQRRALYIMYTEEKEQGREFRKLATIVGDVFGKAHPHESSISGAIVTITQDWKNLIPFIEGAGNWGTPSGDPAAAARYITCRLSKLAYATFFDEFDDSVVDMEQSDLNPRVKLPVYLPAKYPVVLLNGSKGIGVGMSTDVPSYNFKEIMLATITLIKNPDARIVLIPDIQTGASIVQTDFAKLCETGRGTYVERCKWEVDDRTNVITITALPIDVNAYDLRTRIQELIDSGGMPELVSIDDNSKKSIEINLKVRDDVNPYKLMAKLIKRVDGLEKVVNCKLEITHNRSSISFGIKRLLLDWIDWRRDQKSIVLANRRAKLYAEYRMNEAKIFVMDKQRLQDTVDIFRTSQTSDEISEKLKNRYGDSEIYMDSYLAKGLSDMRMLDLTESAYKRYLKKRSDLEKEIADLERTLTEEKGIDKLIIAELQDGIKRFGGPRCSDVVPAKISIVNEVEGYCSLQLSSDGNILRTTITNCEGEIVPTDPDGFACKVDNDSSFILVDESGHHAFIKVKEVPLDTEVPVMRFASKALTGNIVAMLPVNMDLNLQCVLVSRMGAIKRIGIRDIVPSKKPLITLPEGDSLNRGIVVDPRALKDILIYTKNGMGQRFRPDTIRATSPSAAGRSGFTLSDGDEIIGCFAISPDSEYLLYTTTGGKMRLNNSSYLPTRRSKNDTMVQLITLNNRDKLVSVKGCHKLDVARVFFNDGTSEDIPIKYMKESTMSSPPVKMTTKNAVSFTVVKVKII